MWALSERDPDGRQERYPSSFVLLSSLHSEVSNESESIPTPIPANLVIAHRINRVIPILFRFSVFV